MARILFFGNFKFPGGDAASARVFALAVELVRLGHAVTVVSCGNNQRLDLPARSGVVSDVEYHCIDHMAPLSSCGKVLSSFGRYFFNVDALRALLDKKIVSKPDVIISYSSGGFSGSRLLKLGSDLGIRIYFDIVEWYSPGQCVGGYFGLIYYDSILFIRCVFKRADGVIVISKFLESYCKRNAVSCVRIPAIALSGGIGSAGGLLEYRKGGGPFLAVYSGFPGVKDLIYPIIKAAEILECKGIPVQFVLTGKNIPEALRSQGFDKETMRIPENVSIRGWISKDELDELRSKASVAIVLRSSNRSSVANFPQKLVEYMWLGLPTIISATGDSKDFVRHMQEGLVLTRPSGESLADALVDIYNMADWGAALGARARVRARTLLAADLYAEKLADFMDVSVNDR